MNIHVKILSKSLVKPSTPTPDHLRIYKLSFFDQVADLAHLPLVLFYPHCNNNPKHEELEESLSRILSHVYPLAGRFTEDESSILCLDQGVTYIKATVNCKLDDFLQQANNDLDLALPFWPHGIMDVDETNLFVTPPMVVQVTTFECGGLALAISSAHPAMDGFAAFTLVYEWAKVCKFFIPSKEINFMSFNLGTLFPTKDLTAILEPPVCEGKRTQSKLIAKKFIFDEVSISKLREEFDSSNVLSFKPSRVEMITSLLWRSLIRAARSPYLKRSVMSFPLNLRGKVVAYPEIASSFGNLIIEIPIKFEHDDETKVESLHHIVKLIRESVQETTSYCAKATPDEIVSLVVNLYNDGYAGFEWGGDKEVVNFTCSSLCRFPIQKTDFGWGKPSLMHFGSRHSQVFWLYDTPCETSIVVQMDLYFKEPNFVLKSSKKMAAEMALVKPIAKFNTINTSISSRRLPFTVRMSATTSPPTSKPTKKAQKQGIKETLLTPRFYTTDFDEMETLFNTEINKNLNEAEFEALLQEFKTDYNQTHFVRNKEFKEAADKIQGPLRNIFVEFLERSCTAEFSGFLLYKELGRRLKKTNPVVAEIFSLMSRDEARHAGFLNKGLSDFNLALDLGFLTKARKYTFFKPKFIFYATYLSEKIGYWRYITIYRHLKSNPEFICYPIFKYFENWCQDENRHGDFFSALMKAQPQFLNDWKAKLWARFFCLSVYVTMYLNDCQRTDFYEGIGLNTKEFDMHVIIETNRTTARIFPAVLDVENPEFKRKLDRMVEINTKLIAVSESDDIPVVKNFKKIPLIGALASELLAAYLMEPIESGSVDFAEFEPQLTY